MDIPGPTLRAIIGHCWRMAAAPITLNRPTYHVTYGWDRLKRLVAFHELTLWTWAFDCVAAVGLFLMGRVWFGLG